MWGWMTWCRGWSMMMIGGNIAAQRSLVSRRCRHNRVQAEDNRRKSFGKPRGQAGNCAPRGLTENAPVERFHGPIAGGLQPAGKGRAPSLTAVIRPRLPGAGAESRLPRGRQARPDLTLVKSGNKEGVRHAPTESSEPHHAPAVGRNALAFSQGRTCGQAG